ncbi:MAG: cobalt ECF transporter T component CbiQ, partial [Desulfovibrionaceae bacterium]
FIMAVLSFGPYTVSTLLPFMLYPVCMAAWGNIPFSYLVRKLCIAAPFVLFVGIFNPVFDTAIAVQVAGISLSAGWISFLSILLRCALTVSAAMILVALTGFPVLCAALARLGMPAVFVTQLLFLYRYIFVLAQEAGRMERARDLRTVGNKGKSLRVYASMLGQLLLRTYDRATRIHQAMLCRGFTGSPPVQTPVHWQRDDSLFMLAWLLFFVAARLYNLPQELGTFFLRICA